MQARIWPASGPPPMASKAIVAPVAARASVRSFKNVGESVRHTCIAPAALQQIFLFLLADDIHQADAILAAEPVEHLPKIGGRGRVHQGLVPLARMVPIIPRAVSGLTKHDAPSAARRAGRQRQTLIHLDASILRIHRAAQHRDRLTQQRLRGSGDAPASVTTPAPSLPTGMEMSMRGAIACTAFGTQGRGQHAAAAGVPETLALLQSAFASKQPEVRWVDRRRLDANDDFIRRRRPESRCSASDSSISPLFLARERS